MAERSFAKEVQKLRLGDGEEFSGEGILAITKALLQCGVGYVGGYQGAPISHLMDVLADAQDILGELGVHFEASASEATATAMLAASVHYPIRGACTYKSTVGTNVASDALANLASGGVTGGALIIVGEDYGEGSSIMQERSHAFAMKSQVWLLDPRPNLPSIVKAVEDGFELSEASNTPVMLQVRIKLLPCPRQVRRQGQPAPGDDRRRRAGKPAPRHRPHRAAAGLLQRTRRRRSRSAGRPPSTSSSRGKINEVFGASTGKIGIVMQGGMYNGVIRALQRLGLADIYGDTEVPLYVLNAVYPLIDDEFLEFCEGKDAVLVIEEGQPNYIEQAFGSLLYRNGGTTRLLGKGYLPVAGEYTGQVMLDGIGDFLRDYAPDILPDAIRAPNRPDGSPVDLPELAKVVPGRPPGFCTGCPERPIFAATKLVEEELGQHHIASDIGCHLFSIMPPFELGATTMGYGLGPGLGLGLQFAGRQSVARSRSSATAASGTTA